MKKTEEYVPQHVNQNKTEEEEHKAINCLSFLEYDEDDKDAPKKVLESLKDNSGKLIMALLKLDNQKRKNIFGKLTYLLTTITDVQNEKYKKPLQIMIQNLERRLQIYIQLRTQDIIKQIIKECQNLQQQSKNQVICFTMKLPQQQFQLISKQLSNKMPHIKLQNETTIHNKLTSQNKKSITTEKQKGKSEKFTEQKQRWFPFLKANFCRIKNKIKLHFYDFALSQSQFPKKFTYLDRVQQNGNTEEQQQLITSFKTKHESREQKLEEFESTFNDSTNKKNNKVLKKQ